MDMMEAERTSGSESTTYETSAPSESVPVQKPVSDFDELSFDGFDFDELDQK